MFIELKWLLMLLKVLHKMYLVYKSKVIILWNNDHNIFTNFQVIWIILLIFRSVTFKLRSNPMKLYNLNIKKEIWEHNKNQNIILKSAFDNVLGGVWTNIYVYIKFFLYK